MFDLIDTRCSKKLGSFSDVTEASEKLEQWTDYDKLCNQYDAAAYQIVKRIDAQEEADRVEYLARQFNPSR